MKMPIKLDSTMIVTTAGIGSLILSSSTSSVIGDLTLFSYSSGVIIASCIVVLTKIILIPD